MPNVFSWNGKNLKSISGSAGFNDAYFTNVDDAATGARLDVVGGLTNSTANQLVPWVNRGVDMVASCIASMPFDLNNAAGDDVKDDPAYESLTKNLLRILYFIAASLWLHGAAYLWPESNSLGRGIQFRFVRKRFIEPIVRAGALWGFRYTDANDTSLPREIPKDDLIYFWMPNLESAVRPGPAPANVVLGSASLLYALGSFVAGFFNSGGVKVTVFEVGSVSDQDKANFQNFLNKSLSGIRNAFRNVVVRFGVKPTVIGSDIKDTVADKLADMARDDVAVGLRVPPSVISGKMTDVLNSRADKFTLYDATIIPLFGMIAEVLNEWFEQHLMEPLTLAAAPERLPIMQEMQLDTGKALSLLTGRPVFKVDEAREVMGLGKWGEGDPDTAPAAPTPVINQVAPAAPGTPPVAVDGEKPAAPAAAQPAKALPGDEFERKVKQYAAARKMALANVGQAVGLPFDDALMTCKTAQETRNVLESHYPRKEAQGVTPDLATIGQKLIEEIKLAREALG